MLVKILGGVVGWSIIWLVDYYITMRERKRVRKDVENVRLHYKEQLLTLKKRKTKY